MLSDVAQTCFEDGFYYLAPLVAPVGNNSDNVPLPHLKTRCSKAALTGYKLLFNSLMKTYNRTLNIIASHYGFNISD